jgi:hypothetical protein
MTFITRSVSGTLFFRAARAPLGPPSRLYTDFPIFNGCLFRWPVIGLHWSERQSIRPRGVRSETAALGGMLLGAVSRLLRRLATDCFALCLPFHREWFDEVLELQIGALGAVENGLHDIRCQQVEPHQPADIRMVQLFRDR